MKRISVGLVGFVVPHFADLIQQFPEGTRDLLKDCERVLRMYQAYGDEYLTIHLPDAQKTFEKALSRGWYPGSFGPDDKLQFKCLSGFAARRHRFLRFFVNRVFDTSGRLLDDACVASVKAIIGTLALYKKVELPCKQEYIQDEVDQFFRIEAELRSPSCDWTTGDFCRKSLVDDISGPVPLLGGEESPRVEKLLGVAQSVADLVASSFGLLDPLTIRAKHGPGAVSDLRRGEDKYVFPSWNRRLDQVFPFSEFGLPSYDPFGLLLEANEPAVGTTDYDAAAKLIAVPKTQKGPRLIASEPTSHMWIQQGIWRHLDDAVKTSLLRHTVNFHDQLPSRLAAQRASSDSRFATVDLKSASDRLTLWTVERVFAANRSLLEAFQAARTMWVKAPRNTDKHERSVVLRKFANQGSALTFPVQSIVYAVFCIAATMYARGMRVTRRNVVTASRDVTVFGDDLILPSTALPYLALILEHNQLKINTAKTHFSGNFAESCGFRGFRGHDVTPTYLTCVSARPSYEEISALVEVSNNFAREWRFELSEFILTLVPSRWLSRLVPTRLVDGLSLFTFSPGLPDCVKVLYNKGLQRDEIVSPVLSAKQRVMERDNWFSLFQFLAEAEPTRHKLSYLDGPNFCKLGVRKSTGGKLRLKRVPIGDRARGCLPS